MTLAEQKQNQNIAEYILFMWQMEDLVRAVDFDAEELDTFIRSYTPNVEAFETEKRWFRELVKKMRGEKVEKRGHISEVHELLFELSYLHNTLLNVIKDRTYIELHRKAQPNILEVQKRNGSKSSNEIESCLISLYGLLVLRLKKEPVSAETEEAMETFTKLLSRLSLQYKNMKDGEKNFAWN